MEKGTRFFVFLSKKKFLIFGTKGQSPYFGKSGVKRAGSDYFHCLKAVMKFVAITLKTCTLKGKREAGIFYCLRHIIYQANQLFEKKRVPDLK